MKKKKKKYTVVAWHQTDTFMLYDGDGNLLKNMTREKLVALAKKVEDFLNGL